MTTLKSVVNCFNTVNGRCCCNQMQMAVSNTIIYLCFNTASGRYNYLSLLFYLLFVQVSSVRTSSSFCSYAVSHSAAHTVSGRYCCNFSRYERIQSAVLVSIPQAVSAVTSSPLFYLLCVQVLAMCGPHRHFAPLLSRTLQRIP